MKKILIAFMLVLGLSCFCGCSAPKTFTVTFVQAGQENIVKTVKSGDDLSEIPTPAEKKGYSIKWNVSDFSNITKDITVTALESANSYVIHYSNSQESLGTFQNELQYVKYDSAYTLQTMTETTEIEFLGWKIKGTDTIVSQQGTWNFDKNIQLEAVWGGVVVNFELGDISWCQGDISGFIESEFYTVGEEVELPKLTVDYSEDKSFNGWNIKGTSTNISSGAKYTFTESVTLVARWSACWTKNY